MCTPGWDAPLILNPRRSVVSPRVRYLQLCSSVYDPRFCLPRLERIPRVGGRGDRAAEKVGDEGLGEAPMIHTHVAFACWTGRDEVIGRDCQRAVAGRKHGRWLISIAIACSSEVCHRYLYLVR